jgi:2-polyprenyl-6-hydroxyphenyl methylase/3-demethylubiquinone-9 3-methyltransferase
MTSLVETGLNQDPAELAKFSALAHRWWDPQSEFKPLHDINPLRLSWIDNALGLPGKRLIDVGCGGGILAESLAQRGAQVTGIDLAEKPLAVARLHLLETGAQVDYQLISAEQMAITQAGQFDAVTCMEMLEHVPEPASIMQACAALLKPGGQAFFSTLNRNPKAYLMAVIGAEYVLKILPKGTHDYARFIKPSELADMARAAGLEVIGFKGLSYHPLSQTYSLGQDISVNYLMQTRKP